MKTSVKRYQHKANRATRIFRSWWMGVLLLLVTVLGLALYPIKFDSVQQGVVPIADDSGRGRSYGIALGDMLYRASDSKRNEVLAKIKKAGFTEVRLSFSWSRAGASEGQYNWVQLDGMMKAVKKSGLKAILLVDSTPTWARQDKCKSSASCPPHDPQDYADFIAAAADRYKDYKISAWEVWNEQNGSNFWKPMPDPDLYARLLKATYVSVKRIDPTAVVLIGGLSGDSADSYGPSLVDPRTYLEKLYAAGIHGYFDGLAYHPYFGTALSMTNTGKHNGWAKMNTGSNSIRNIMIANGDADKDIWITEFGIPTGGKGPAISDPNQVPAKADHATLDAQAQIVEAVTDSINSSPWIHNFIWYTYQDDTLAKTFDGAAYGIWQQDGTPKPVLKVMQKAIQLNGANSE